MVLIALAIVFAGIGAMALSSSDTEDPEAAPSSPTTTASVVATQSNSTPPETPTATTPPDPTTTVPPTTTASVDAVDKTVPVRVFNNSMVAGLAAQTAGELTASGWNVAETGNYGSTNVPKTTVYYGSSTTEQAAAVAIAEELGVTAEPRFPGIADSPSGVIVIVTGN
ncbi:LytR C-terminal domain-containing protein [Nocardia uniformis]|uniref:LytR C-terminal domain-containing protein n=2 Tax=Nocardia uniformis TaxID=53432 RepID=A0A849CFN6_9NOCA|nr:LytR C-terminal domain-containing protein [Nocardia uniformis]